MPYIDLKSSTADVRWRLALFLVVLMLASDALNPVKVVCSILSISTGWITAAALIASGLIIAANANDMVYFTVKMFMSSILSTVFSSVEVLGLENIPKHGPIIFTGNHMNQFVDGLVILATCPHTVGFLIAEKSFKKPIIGHLAKAAGCIPVVRPQDVASKGVGQVRFDGCYLDGRNGVDFSTQLKSGDRLRPGKCIEGFRVKAVVSPTRVELAPEESQPFPSMAAGGSNDWLSYDILHHVDQNDMFHRVHVALSAGQNLGIFPEGGSHDNTHLLPLKAGIAVIAFGTMEKFDVNVKIVPVGLNYFRGHRFRGRVVVEFGTPLTITPELFETYKQSKRKGYQELLTQVETGMKSVIVTANDYGELKLIHTARRLYQRIESSTNHKQDLAKRFAIGFRMIVDKFHADVLKSDPQHGSVCSVPCRYNTLPAEIKAAIKRLEEYQNLLDDWGLKDYQVNSLDSIDRNELLYTFTHAFVILVLASIPTLFLNAPVGLAASFYAQKEAKKDLAASRVKLAARDVLLSKKIVFSMAAVPLLLVTYGVLLRLFTSWETRTIVVLMLACPLFSYLGVISMQAGMIDLKDLRPAFLRLMPGFNSQTQRLPAMRAELQQEVRRLIHKYGEQLGPLYTDQSLDVVAFSSAAAPKEAVKSDAATASKSTEAVETRTLPATAATATTTSAADADAEVLSVSDPSSSSGLKRTESGEFGLAALPVMPEFEETEGAEGEAEAVDMGMGNDQGDETKKDR